MFAPGIISTLEGFEYAISFHPKGNEILLSRRVPVEIYDNNHILSMKLERKGWSELKLAPFAANYKAGESIFSPDGKHVIFGSTRPNPVTSESNFDAWIVDYTKKDAAPQLLPERIWLGDFSRRLPRDIQRVARRKLRMLNNAQELADLRAPPGNRLELLKGNRSGQHSIRINDQWRICFRWEGRDAINVEIVDYPHG